MRRTFLVSLLLVVSACTEERVISPQLVPGEMVYRASSASGRPLLEGRLSIAISDDSLVTGFWDIGWAQGADTTTEVGPQVGSGRLVGSRLGPDRFSISLNPDYADYNVYLDARRTRDGWSGAWAVYGLTGTMAEGAFEASGGPSSPPPTDAVVRYLGIEGGCWMLETADARYQPLNLPDEFRVDGLAVRVALTAATDVATTCMAGLPVRVNSIARR